MKKIEIKLNKEETNLSHTEDCTELDFVLGIATMFDRLTPVTKKLLIKKLEKLTNLSQGKLTGT